ncbi:MAG: hypothetical protein PHP97_04520 [Candidatus Shapirobacteria bacterium]|nr:hypothetical protein [Candidatus Shapirobacteria bacterium]MDD3002675.1 hypothetical protein [Candidatus Shapirobacteria bacterium]MDD4382879.1 hypothetical protein [Candidatus Shapirobacteria bacterium]
MNHLTNQLLAYTLTGPGIAVTSGADSISTLEKIISSIIGILTIVGVIYFTIQIILAGFSLIASQGDPKEFQSSKKRLTTNVIGLVIIIIAYGLGALIASLLGMNSIFDLSTVFQPI